MLKYKWACQSFPPNKYGQDPTYKAFFRRAIKVDSILSNSLLSYKHYSELQIFYNKLTHEVV